MSRELNSIIQRLLDAIDKVEDPILKEELLNTVQGLIFEAKYTGKPRDVLDMD